MINASLSPETLKQDSCHDSGSLSFVQPRGGEFSVTHAEQTGEQEFRDALDIGVAQSRLQETGQITQEGAKLAADRRHQLRHLLIAVRFRHYLVA